MSKDGYRFLAQRQGPIRSERCFVPVLCSRTKGGCKSYVDACHTSDKGKGRGSAVLANANPAAVPPRPQPAKKAPSPTQPPKKHRVSLYYAKYKPGTASPAAAAATATAEEEQRDLSPAPPLTPEPEVCSQHHNNNDIAVGDEDDDSCRSTPTTEKPTHFKEEPPRGVEDKGPAPVTFPMETPARPPHSVAAGAGPGPRGAPALCSPAGQSLAKQRTQDGTYSERRESAELEVRTVQVARGNGVMWFRMGFRLFCLRWGNGDQMWSELFPAVLNRIQMQNVYIRFQMCSPGS